MDRRGIKRKISIGDEDTRGEHNHRNEKIVRSKMEGKTGYNLLMAENRDEWDRWNMIVAPYGKKKGFWWTMILQPPSLVDETVLEGDTGRCPDGAGGAGAMRDTTVAELKAYKSDMETKSYLAMCLKNFTDLLHEAQMAGNSAATQYAYLDAKF